MEKIKFYQKLIVDFLKEHNFNLRQESELENEIITDYENGHFQSLTVGWENGRHIYKIHFHLDIKPDGKIWIMANNTDTLVAEELLQRGVPKTDIVLGLKPPYMRSFTGFAVA